MSFGQLLVLVIIVGFILVALVDKFLENGRRERQHRERLAMIDKGIVPSPEADPARWESGAEAARAAACAAATRGLEATAPNRQHGNPRDFARALGVLIVFSGIGVGALLWVLGERRGAVGISAMVICVGAAFLVISSFRPSAGR
jgi:hypothetical protein